MNAITLANITRILTGDIGPTRPVVRFRLGVRAPVVGGTVAGGHIMLAEMRACAVGGTGGCKPGTERVGLAPLTSINGLYRYPDFTW